MNIIITILSILDVFSITGVLIALDCNNKFNVVLCLFFSIILSIIIGAMIVLSNEGEE